CQHYYTAPSSF
nr:immunoglobulin light chain junction region [Macaca mulatta]